MNNFNTIEAAVLSMQVMLFKTFTFSNSILMKKTCYTFVCTLLLVNKTLKVTRNMTLLLNVHRVKALLSMLLEGASKLL